MDVILQVALVVRVDEQLVTWSDNYGLLACFYQVTRILTSVMLGSQETQWGREGDKTRRHKRVSKRVRLLWPALTLH